MAPDSSVEDNTTRHISSKTPKSPSAATSTTSRRSIRADLTNVTIKFERFPSGPSHIKNATMGEIEMIAHLKPISPSSPKIVDIGVKETSSGNATKTLVPPRPQTAKCTSISRNRLHATALPDEDHKHLIFAINTVLLQNFDKHERFEGLRYLSKVRRGQLKIQPRDDLCRSKASLAYLLSERKSRSCGNDGDCSEVDESVFLSTPRRQGASEIAAIVKRGVISSSV